MLNTIYALSKKHSEPSNHPAIQPSNWRRRRPAFTLVELMLYVALVSIFILTLTDIFVAILNTKVESEATNAVEQDSRFIIARLSYDIRRATQITTPANPGDTPTTTLTSIAGVPPSYSYTLDTANGILKLDGVPLNSSETKISGLSFQKLGNVGGKETITVQFTITSQTTPSGGAETKTYKTTIGRRR